MPRFGPPNPQANAQPVLTDEERHQVAQWLGEFEHPSQIPALVKERFGKTVSRIYAYEFLKKKKFQPLIDRYRQDWLVGTLKVPAANRRYRLERLQELIDRLDRRSERGEVRDLAYEQRLRALLQAARLEMEERREGDQYFFTNINSFTDEELVAKREELVRRIQAFKLPVRRRTDAVGDKQQIVEATKGDTSQDAGRVEESRDPSGNGPVVSETPEG